MTLPQSVLDPKWRNQNISPSDNFYQYANGNWLINNPVPNDRSMWGAFTEIQEVNDALLKELLSSKIIQKDSWPSQLAKNYYKSGNNQKLIEKSGVQPLQTLLDDISSASDLKSISRLIAKLQVAGLSAPFGIAVAPDFENPYRYLLYLSQGGLGLPERSYYVNPDEAKQQIQEQYKIHISEQFQNLGYSNNDSNNAANNIFNTEAKLANASFSPEQLRDVTLTLKKYTIQQIKNALTNINIEEILEELGVNATEVSVDNIGFLQELDNQLADTPLEIVKQYLTWHLIRQYASSLPSKFEDSWFNFYGKTLSGQAEPKPRWKRVLDLATNDIGEAVAQVYVGAAFSESSKKRCEHMVQNLLSAMKESINSLDWMTNTTKAAAQAKLEKFTYKIGYPDVWRDYSKLELKANMAFAAHRLAATTFEAKRQIDRLNSPVDRDEWEMPAHMVNAYYHPLLNTIVFPAGILQPPMFYEKADDSVIYGGIGTIIGHEITHGFDDQGSRFDGDGSLQDWWTNDDRAEFDRRSQVLVKQFNNYKVDKLHVNGQLTLGENIADLGGLKLAYEALRLSKINQQLTTKEKQRFFLSYATIWRMNYKPEIAALLINIDSHSPAEYRANGPLSNFEEFAKCYGIKDTSLMRRNSTDIIKIW